jgi:hypothetical protein
VCPGARRSDDSSPTCREFASKSRAFSTTTPAWAAIDSMSATSSGAISGVRVTQSAMRPPTRRSFETMGTNICARCGVAVRISSGRPDSSATFRVNIARRVDTPVA